MPDVVLTGLPRSGSTLTCHLLNHCADTVALHEPMPMGQFTREHRGGDLVNRIVAFYQDCRNSLLTRGSAPSVGIDGQVPDNMFGALRGQDDLRRNLAVLDEVSFDKPLSPDFVLAIKHNAGFTALLEPLMERLPCYGIVRHPLAVLCSWNSVDLPVQQGRIPVAERIHPELRAELDALPTRADRQLRLVEWFFERMLRLLPRASILRYEDLIATQGRVLSVAAPAAAALREEMTSLNDNPAYERATLLDLGRRLLERDGAFWELYSKDSVREMMAKAEGA